MEQAKPIASVKYEPRVYASSHGDHPGVRIDAYELNEVKSGQLSISAFAEIVAKERLEDRFFVTYLSGYGTLIGVLDGHGGHQVADMASLRLGDMAWRHIMANPYEIPTALTNAFHEFDELLRDPAEVRKYMDAQPKNELLVLPHVKRRKKIWSTEEEEEPLTEYTFANKCGSTALLIHISEDGDMCAAYAGDTGFMFIPLKGKTFYFRDHHNPGDPIEKARIIAAGHTVGSSSGEPRIDSKRLNVCRGFGDFDFKNLVLDRDKRAVIATPSIYEGVIFKGDKLALFSDGATSVLRPVNLKKWLSFSDSAKSLCTWLTGKPKHQNGLSFRHNPDDNLTLLLVTSSTPRPWGPGGDSTDENSSPDDDKVFRS